MSADVEKLKAGSAELTELRDRFAIVALPIVSSQLSEEVDHILEEVGVERFMQTLARSAYLLADAMIEARGWHA